MFPNRGVAEQTLAKSFHMTENWALTIRCSISPELREFPVLGRCDSDGSRKVSHVFIRYGRIPYELFSRSLCTVYSCQSINFEFYYILSSAICDRKDPLQSRF